MSQPKKHHYIPVFYLCQWCGENGCLCEYSRPYKGVATRWKHPTATAYVEGLNTIPGLPPEEGAFVERVFLQYVDDWAAKALSVFLQPEPRTRDLSVKEQVGWARFV